MKWLDEHNFPQCKLISNWHNVKVFHLCHSPAKPHWHLATLIFKAYLHHQSHIENNKCVEKMCGLFHCGRFLEPIAGQQEQKWQQQTTLPHSCLYQEERAFDWKLKIWWEAEVQINVFKVLVWLYETNFLNRICSKGKFWHCLGLAYILKGRSHREQ